jgi:hypothetical protein
MEERNYNMLMALTIHNVVLHRVLDSKFNGQEPKKTYIAYSMMTDAAVIH